MPRSLIHVFAVFILLTALIFLNSVGLLNGAFSAGRRAVEFLDRPLLAVFFPIRGTFEFFGSLKQLSKQNEILSRQVVQLADEVAKLENAAYENRVLRDALGFSKGNEARAIPAEIVSFDPLRPEQKATLSRGQAQGVAAGDAVVAAGGAMVGVISQALADTSQMDLLTSSSVVVTARTSTGEATGVVRGEHGLGLLFDLIAKSETVRPNDRVVSSGLGGQYPQNLLLGTVGEIRVGSGDLFQQASVIPAANLKNLRFVVILKK